MKYDFTKESEIKSSNLEHGDLLLFNRANGEPSGSIYMICYDESLNSYYLQNMNGFKKKPVYHKTINELLVGRKNYRIIKKGKATLSISLNDALVCNFSPF